MLGAHLAAKVLDGGLETAASVRDAQRAERHLDRAEHAEHHGRVDVTHVGDPERAALQIANPSAEDDANIRQGLVATLESEGYAVTPANDGAQALKLFPQEKFDLVLLDVMMPKASGYDVCRELRARGATVPVLFLTAKGEEVDKVVGLKLGADDYVTKPFGVHELLARVEALIRRGRTSGSGGAAEALASNQV